MFGVAKKEKEETQEKKFDFSRISEENVERLAKLFLNRVPHNQIAHFFNISEEDVNLIANDRDFQTHVQNLYLEEHDIHQTIAEGLDKVEMLALQGIINNLKNVVDPDYALKALNVANKSVRRHKGTGVNPVDASSGQVIVLELNQNFVTHVQNNGLISSDKDPKTIENDSFNLFNNRKAQDFLDSEKVEKLLTEGEADYQTVNFSDLEEEVI